VTEPTEIDDIFRKGKERLEWLAKIVPSRALSQDELTKSLISMYRMIVALQAECDMLKVWVDELKANQHAAGNVIVVADQTMPEDPASE
jgi:hypothetical protein